MSLSASDFTTLTSKDGQQFIIETKVIPSKMGTALNYPAKIVQKIIEYLYFKYMYQSAIHKKIPNFDIQPQQAL